MLSETVNETWFESLRNTCERVHFLRKTEDSKPATVLKWAPYKTKQKNVIVNGHRIEKKVSPSKLFIRNQ